MSFIQSNSFEFDYHGPVVQTARIELLDLIKQCAQTDHRFFLEKFDVEISGDERPTIAALLKGVHWGTTWRECSRLVDELDRIVQIRPYSKQTRYLSQFKRKLDRFVGKAWSDREITRVSRGTTESKSLWAARVIVRDHFPVIDYGTDSLERTSSWSSWSMTIERNLTLLALSLEEFRKDHGKYPATLKVLMPRYLETLPEDPLAKSIWSRKTPSFKYQLTGADYRLYSVGFDGKDNGGDPDSDIVIGAAEDPNYHD